MNRAEFWYIFGLAAITLIALRLRGIRRENLRDPMAWSFTLCLFLPAFGTLSKQPFIANFIDRLLGPNAAWLVADIFFITGVTVGTYWIEMLGDPSLREEGWRLLKRWRVLALILVAAWMVIAARLEWTTWMSLERGGIDVGGKWLLLSNRLVYFGYSIWILAFLARGFNRHRQAMQNRNIYIRMSLPWAAISLAIAAPVLQAAGAGLVFARPELLQTAWPLIWKLVTMIQLVVAVLILAIFIGPAYGFIIWLDKQRLIRRLLQVRQTIAHSRPDLIREEQPLLGRPGWPVREPDRWLATLVNEIELLKSLIGPPTDEVRVPAGAAMPEVARLILQDERAQLQRGLAREPVTTYRVTGDFYALARWYAAVL